MRTKFLFILIFFGTTAYSQTTEIDSLKKLLPVTPETLDRVNYLEALSYAYLSSYPDTALKYAMDGLQLAKNIDSRKGEAICINAIGNVYFNIGDNAKALEMFLQYLKIKEETKRLQMLYLVAYFNIAGVYMEDKDYRHALFYVFKAKVEDEKAKDSSAILYDMYSLGTLIHVWKKMILHYIILNQCYRLVQILTMKI